MWLENDCMKLEKIRKCNMTACTVFKLTKINIYIYIYILLVLFYTVLTIII